MNEIVKYKNEINALKFKGFTKTDMNFFMTLCAKVKDQGENEISFSFDYLKQLTNYSSTDVNDFISDLERMNAKLAKITGRFEIEDKIVMFVLFPTFEIDKKKQILTVAVNPKFSYLLNDVIAPFTRFDLREFVQLESKYSKNLYRLLKQWKSTGKMIINDIDDFREKMDVPKAYNNGTFVRDVINPSIEELQKVFNNLKCEPVYAQKRGKPLVGFIFSFQPEEQSQNKDISLGTTNKSTLTNSAKKYNSYPQRNYSTQELDELERKLLAL